MNPQNIREGEEPVHIHQQSLAEADFSLHGPLPQTLLAAPHPPFPTQSFLSFPSSFYNLSLLEIILFDTCLTHNSFEENANLCKDSVLNPNRSTNSNYSHKVKTFSYEFKVMLSISNTTLFARNGCNQASIDEVNPALGNVPWSNSFEVEILLQILKINALNKPSISST